MPLPVWLVTVCLKHRIPPPFFLSYFLLCVMCVCCGAYGGQRETGVVPLPLLCEFWGLDSVYRACIQLSRLASAQTLFVLRISVTHFTLALVNLSVS